MSDDSLELSPSLKSMTASYLFFVFAYSSSIMVALLVGGVGGLVPVDSVWFQIVDNLFVQSGTQSPSFYFLRDLASA